MGALLEKFRQNVAKNKDPRMREEGDMDVLYSTGFPCFDFINRAESLSKIIATVVVPRGDCNGCMYKT